MKRYFWDSWKRLTAQEKISIEGILDAKKVIVKEIPKSELIALYVKGSFIRREMNSKSDVDMSIIVKSNRYLHKIEKLKEGFKTRHPIEISFGGLSLWEFKNKKRFGKSNKPRAGPGLFLRKVNQYKLIYGNAINSKNFPVREDKRALGERIKTFRNLFIPLYYKGDIDFSGLIKQVFWLVETELKYKGKKVPETWKGMAKAIKDKKHIIHKTLYLRNNQTKNKRIRNTYVKNLEMYLK